MSRIIFRIAVFFILLCNCCLAPTLFAQEQAEPVKIIFDCDLGDDIDDAYALALLLASPEFDVLGIVMDYGNTPERARMASKLLYEIGREDVPVIAGRKTNDEYSPQYYWSKGFDALKYSSQSASDFILSMFKKYPNEVVLLTVGPVPNMKDLLEKDAKALLKAKHVYSMFGSFYMGYERDLVPDMEWNVKADIEAAKIFAEAAKKITYVPLDVTTFVKMTGENRAFLTARQTPLTDFLSGVYPLWRFMPYAKADPTLYDAVAVGIILWPELFETRPAHVKVEGKGYTVIAEGEHPNSEIAMGINEKEFVRRMMERFLKQNLNNQH
jgi:inosine-uridine nucleoside N-ribohydrolase